VRLERVTAAEAEALQARIAGALERRGLRSGDRVAFSCPNSVELLCGILGAARVGIAPVPMNPALLDEERAVILDNADPALVVGPRELAELVDGTPVELAPAPLARPMH
jgi:long-chain acyl-CoA synthetase